MSKQRLAMQHAVSLTITADTEQLAVNLTPVTRQTSIPSQVLANIWGHDDTPHYTCILITYVCIYTRAARQN